jgi:pyrroline-5-carboxylate reductase
MSEQQTIAIMGAGGKMGCRITDNLRESPEYRMLYVEVSEAGKQNLAKRGCATTPQAEAIPQADFVILAVPDNRIEQITSVCVPQMKPGATLIALDPAAPCAGRLFKRADVNFFASHPCHPPLFDDETDPEARKDYFGGIKARQNIVCALFQGPDGAYAPAEAVCKQMYRPVINSYRVTVEQMAILEPALSETTIATCIVIMKEAIEEAVRRGVPRDAAYAFAMGHIKIAAAIVFGEISSPFSDAAKKAVERAKSLLFKPDWKRVFDDDSNRECLEMITRPPESTTGGPAPAPSRAAS